MMVLCQCGGNDKSIMMIKMLQEKSWGDTVYWCEECGRVCLEDGNDKEKEWYIPKKEME